MKKKFSKILGVGLTLALVTSLLMMAAPVSALTQPDVSLDDDEISADAVYTITFAITKALDNTDEIVVTFETGIDISAITDAVDGDVTIGCSSGIGVNASVATDAGSTTDEQELTITVPVMPGQTAGGDIGAGATVQLVIGAVNPIVNPDDIGDYTLTVGTQTAVPVEIEAAVTSAPFTIIVPTIDVLPGIVQQFNAVNILMAQDTGFDAINDMVGTAGEDYTIVVGPGEYAITATIDLDQAGLTLVSSAGAEDTIIDATAVSYGILISAGADGVTVDGFTVNDAISSGIWCMADDAIIQNNVVTFDEYYGIGIDVGAGTTGVTVSDNEIGDWGTMFVHGTDTTLSGNTFGECVNISGTVAGLTITDNTMIASAAEAIDFISGAFTDVLIEGNTISEAALNAIVIRGTITNLQILDNDITDNEGVGILIASGVTTTTDSAIAIKFNTITGNDADNDGYGIQNEDDDAVVDATLNWWGTDVADDVAAMVNDTTTSITTYEPFLAGTAEAVLSASDVAVGEASLDAKTTVGVRVSVALVGGGASVADVISVAKYTANPQAAKADAIAFFDVYVVGSTVPATDLVTIKFYVGDENSTLEVWSADTEAWADLSEDDSFGFSTYGGYIYIDYAADLLDGTPFVVVAGEAVADVLAAPEISTPTSGASDVSLTPIFAWEAVDDADGYYFEFADNANFVLPLTKLDGDTGRLIVTAYAYVGTLPYSTAYYWRVKAVSGTIDAGDLAESGWASAIFITMDEPVEPIPPIVIEPTPPAPIITIEQPDIIIPLPDVVETPITPSWIYVIIGVGAVLVIALLVLIVRTRRVA